MDDAFVQPCRRCGEARAWLLRPLRERGGDPLPVDVVEKPGRRSLFHGPHVALGWYEVLVCAGCGHAQFWARDFAPERPSEPGPACAGCEGSDGWSVAVVHERCADDYLVPMRVKLASTVRKASLMFSRGGWQASLSARICRGCGAGAWACVPDAVHYPEDFDDGKASPRACVRCQGPQWLVALEDVLDQGDQRSVSPRRVTNETRFWILDFGGGGRFVGDVCKRCLTFEWYGLELDKLRENPKRGVSRLVRGLPAGGGSGPYR